jgi:single stranded DNA-binding protein
MANQVYLTGNISRDTKLVPTSTGTPMAYLNVAAEREWEGANGTNRRTEFFSVVCFGDLATDAVRLGVKGRPIAVDGSLRMNQRDNPDGSKRYDLEIVADALHELEARTPSRNGPEAQEPAAAQEHAL